MARMLNGEEAFSTAEMEDVLEHGYPIESVSKPTQYAIKQIVRLKALQIYKMPRLEREFMLNKCPQASRYLLEDEINRIESIDRHKRML